MTTGTAQASIEIAPAGYDRQQNAIMVIDPPNRKVVPANSTDMVVAQSGLGALGDWLSFCIINVTDPATSQFTIKDGTNVVFDAPANRASGKDFSTLPGLGASEAGAWKITTGAGVSVVARGRF